MHLSIKVLSEVTWERIAIVSAAARKQQHNCDQRTAIAPRIAVAIAASVIITATTHYGNYQG
jgi:hypothetical protein